MKVNLIGDETIDVPQEILWDALIDPATLQKAVPVCQKMRAVGAADYIMTLDLKVAAISGSFEGKIALSDMSPLASGSLLLSPESRGVLTEVPDPLLEIPPALPPLISPLSSCIAQRSSASASSSCPYSSARSAT